MDRWIDPVTGVIVALFVLLTAFLTFKTKRIETDGDINKKSFDVIVGRLDKTEAELDELKSVKSKYEILLEKYNSLTESYNQLLDESKEMKLKIKELELKEGV